MGELSVRLIQDTDFFKYLENNINRINKNDAVFLKNSFTGQRELKPEFVRTR